MLIDRWYTRTVVEIRWYKNDYTNPLVQARWYNTVAKIRWYKIVGINPLVQNRWSNPVAEWPSRDGIWGRLRASYTQPLSRISKLRNYAPAV